MYKKIKKQNGERFAQAVRNHHNGIFEIPDIDVILKYAGRETTPLLLNYLVSKMPINEQKTLPKKRQNPFKLLKKAGYKAFLADTLEKQNSIKSYFRRDELLCTFNNKARFQRNYVIHAIRHDASDLVRRDFNGVESRQDAYGTSVISIQMFKDGGFISIKNRYNHTVPGCDHTFDSNPDNIIDGLSDALKTYFNVDFHATASPLGYGFVLMGDNIFKYNFEINNIYYGDQAWAENGQVHAVNKSAGDALFEGFLFSNKTKKLIKIDTQSKDSFADDFNACYGGNSLLNVRKGSLFLGDHCLINAECSEIKELDLPDLEIMGNNSLYRVPALVTFNAPNLKSMGKQCLQNTPSLKYFRCESLEKMKNKCLQNTRILDIFCTPNLKYMSFGCLENTSSISQFYAPTLVKMGGKCLLKVKEIKQLNTSSLATYPRYLEKIIPRNSRKTSILRPQ